MTRIMLNHFLQVTLTIGDEDDDTSAAEARGAHTMLIPIEGQGRRKITINTSDIEDKVLGHELQPKH